VASVSASHLIIFIASVIIAASVAGVLTNTVDELSQAVDDLGLSVSEDVRTDVEIISDSGAQVYDTDGNGNITLYVKNTGSQRLAAESDAMDIFVNGQFKTGPDVNVTVVDGDVWTPGNVVRVEIDHALGAGEDVRVQITVNGDQEVFEFRT